jgi:hypothetical protein
MYKFDPNGELPETAFRAIAIDQLSEALSDLDQPDTSERSAVHEARRRTKKLRGLLRLVRAGFEDFEKENAALRDAAGVLSHLRDREVQHETLVALAKWKTTPLLSRLLAASGEVGPHDNRKALEEFRDHLKEVRDRAEHWTLSRTGIDTLSAGLRRNYRTARRRMGKAKRSDAPEQFHEWRKGNKAHGFQLDLLRKAASETIDGDLTVVDKLSGILGQHHDLVVLRTAADQNHLPLSGPEEVDELNDLIGERLDELEHDAIELGRQVYAERPRGFVRRMMAYWTSAKS